MQFTEFLVPYYGILKLSGPKLARKHWTFNNLWNEKQHLLKFPFYTIFKGPGYLKWPSLPTPDLDCKLIRAAIHSEYHEWYSDIFTSV